MIEAIFLITLLGFFALPIAIVANLRVGLVAAGASIALVLCLAYLAVGEGPHSGMAFLMFGIGPAFWLALPCVVVLIIGAVSGSTERT